MLTWIWIIQITIVSIILIFLVHHLINFFKSVLTVPKIKDLVNTHNEKYKNIYETISQNNYNNYKNNNNNNDFKIPDTNITYNLEDILPPNTNINIHNNNDNTMKSELKNFLKSQLHN
uniref:Uncharacterized protein n=1 Tax=viral metagenome TaxID=1070528 RepID=A0A6C0JFK0_9ZZZZ